MPIITSPLVPPISSIRRGERVNQVLAVPATIAHMLSEISAIATKYGLHAEEDQVGRAREPDEHQDHHRPLHQRSDAERDRYHLDVHASLAADHGRDAGQAAELQ
jgi:hypothetical protein